MDKKTAFWLVAFGVLLSAAVNNLGVFAGALTAILGVFKPVVLGFAIAFVINVPMRFIEGLGKKRAVPRAVSLILSLLIIIGIIVGVSLIIIPQLLSSTMALVAKLPEWVNWLKDGAIKLYDNPEFAEWIGSLSINWQTVTQNALSFLKNGAFDWLSSAASVASGAVGNVAGAAVSFIIALGAVSCKEKLSGQISRTVRAFLKPKISDRLIGTTRMISQAYTGFFSATLTEAVILGTLVLTGMLILGFPRPFMVASLVSIGALIPLFGAFIAAVLSAFLIAAEFSLVTGAWFMLFFIVLQQIEGNVIYPRVMGNSIGLPAIWVLIAVVVGGNALGVLGMILFVPLISVVYRITREEVSLREQCKN